MAKIDLYEYIEHKIGQSIPEIIADSPERFSVIRTEAVRDLVIMNRIAGAGYDICCPPEVMEDAECRRLIEEAVR